MLNPIDTYFLPGQYPRELLLRHRPEVCGTEAVGPGVTAADTAISVGDRVVALSQRRLRRILHSEAAQ